MVRSMYFFWDQYCSNMKHQQYSLLLLYIHMYMIRDKSYRILFSFLDQASPASHRYKNDFPSMNLSFWLNSNLFLLFSRTNVRLTSWKWFLNSSNPLYPPLLDPSPKSVSVCYDYILIVFRTHEEAEPTNSGYSGHARLKPGPAPQGSA